MQTTFKLVGPFAGQTVTFGQFPFMDGSLTFVGNEEETRNIKNLLAYNSAFPEDEFEARQKAFLDANGGEQLPLPVVDDPVEARRKTEAEELEAQRAREAEAEARKLRMMEEATREQRLAEVQAKAEERADKAPTVDASQEDDEMTVVEFLQTLDPENDAHWTKQGLPSMEAIEVQFGKGMTRADVEAAAPGFNRTAAQAAKAID